jgi:hypothetical protein
MLCCNVQAFVDLADALPDSSAQTWAMLELQLLQLMQQLQQPGSKEQWVAARVEGISKTVADGILVGGVPRIVALSV